MSTLIDLGSVGIVWVWKRESYISVDETSRYVI